MKEQRMWAVKGPYPGYSLFSAYMIRRMATMEFESSMGETWKTLYRRGYRCVRVTVKEEGSR
jgi:hypothetical protein